MTPEIKKKISVKTSLLILLFASFLFTACDKAKETVEEAAEKTGEVISETAEKVGDVTEENINEVVDEIEELVDNKDLIGTWKGKFDGRKTVLVISSQDGNNFVGKISINYREAINQELKGSIDSETNKMTMVDQLHSRYAGKYEGTLSDDKTTYSGVFTVKADGKKYKFNLSK